MNTIQWNIEPENAVRLINRHIHFLFQIKSAKRLKLQYIQMNLQKCIVENCGFCLQKNGKNRNINNYILIHYKNWKSFFQESNYFCLKNDCLFLKIKQKKMMCL